MMGKVSWDGWWLFGDVRMVEQRAPFVLRTFPPRSGGNPANPALRQARERGKSRLAYDMGGWCWIHGWACSKVAEAARTVSSSYFGPMIWRPTGRLG